MDLGMQRLDAPAHDFGEAGMLRDFRYRDEVFDKQFGGSAGRQNVDAFLLQRLRKFHDAVLVGYADKRTAHGPVIGIEHNLAYLVGCLIRKQRIIPETTARNKNRCARTGEHRRVISIKPRDINKTMA